VSVKKLLLIDDDHDFLDIIKHVLEAQGYKTLCASGPQQALAQMEEEKPDLVVTDLMMRNLDSGFSLSRQIKEDPRFSDVPVIIVTAIGRQRGFDFTPHTSEELTAMRADAYVDKPVSPQALLAKVHELLNRRSGKAPT